MTARFANKVVMVTGAAGNLGQAVARAFASEGANLVLVDRSQERLDTLVGELGGDHHKYPGYTADTGSESDIDAIVARAEEHFQRLDMLVHTVGGYDAGKPVHEAGLEVWDKMMNLNARSVYLVCGRVARHMVERSTPGRIVAILSRNALKGAANAAAYSASKAAAQRVLESMADELGRYNITVNGIMPSMIDTPQNRAASPNADYSKWVKPEQIAEAILFLTSDEASAISGISLPIYGRV